jgi:phage shock protein C
MSATDSTALIRGSAAGRRTWVRSQDGLVAGVCSGLARAIGVEPWIIRLLWMIVVFAFGTGILFYFLAMLTLPREDRVMRAERKKIMGVCLRISHASGIEVGLVRLIALSSLVMSFGMTFVAYLVLWFVLPTEQEMASSRSRNAVVV